MRAAGLPPMRSTDEKAKSGMAKFVAAIFAIAVMLAGFYFLYRTPGDPGGEVAPEAYQQAD